MTLLTRGSRWPSCFIQWCYTPAVWREWNFQVRSLQKQSLWQTQNKFCRAWKCRRTSLVSCSWPQPVLPGPAACLTCSKAPLARSLPPLHPGRARVLLPACRHREPAPRAAASWQGKAGKLQGQFEGWRACGKRRRAQLQRHPLQGWKSVEST